MWNSHFISIYILFFVGIGTNSSFNCIPNPCASFFTFNYSWLHRIRTTKFCSGIFFQNNTLKFYRFILLIPLRLATYFTWILRNCSRSKNCTILRNLCFLSCNLNEKLNSSCVLSEMRTKSWTN